MSKTDLMDENALLRNKIMDLEELIEHAKDELSYHIDEITLKKAFGEDVEDEIEELNFE
jgi:hypothetical protein